MRNSGDFFYQKGKKAEAYVHELALRTFLTDWCYPNPQLPDGNELCDLLVVFDQSAVIFQIKDLKLDKNGKYKKSEVEKNLRQLSGARRQMFELRAPIQLQNPRRIKEQFDPSRIKEIFLISVLFGEGESFFPMVEAIKSYTAHVFTKEFTQILLKEMDTITDFTAYLREKEYLISTSHSFVILGGEEELLAQYLLNGRSFSHLASGPDLCIVTESWQQFKNDPRYKAKKEEDSISYGWDDLINRAHEGSTDYEIVARELARPSRFHRRILSKAFLDAQLLADNDKVHYLYRRTMELEGVTYCLIFYDERISKQKRQANLQMTCFLARGLFKQNQKVIGISTEKQFTAICSYDFCLLIHPEWTDEDKARMEKIQEKTGIWMAPTIAGVTEEEYPHQEDC